MSSCPACLCDSPGGGSGRATLPLGDCGGREGGGLPACHARRVRLVPSVVNPPYLFRCRVAAAMYGYSFSRNFDWVCSAMSLSCVSVRSFVMMCVRWVRHSNVTYLFASRRGGVRCRPRHTLPLIAPPPPRDESPLLGTRPPAGPALAAPRASGEVCSRRRRPPHPHHPSLEQVGLESGQPHRTTGQRTPTATAGRGRPRRMAAGHVLDR